MGRGNLTYYNKYHYSIPVGCSYVACWGSNHFLYVIFCYISCYRCYYGMLYIILANVFIQYG